MDLVIKKALEALSQSSIYCYSDVEALYQTVGSLDKTIELVGMASGSGLSLYKIINVIKINEETSLHKPARVIMSSTPIGNGNWYNKLWEAAVPKLSHQDMQITADKLASHIDAIRLNADGLADIGKSLRGSMQATIIWPEKADKEPWYDKQLDILQGDTESFATHYNTVEKVDPMTATKLSPRGNVLVDQSAVGNPTGWYYKDNNVVMVSHLPKPEPPKTVRKEPKLKSIDEEVIDPKESKTITKFDITHASIGPDGITVGGTPTYEEKPDSKPIIIREICEVYKVSAGAQECIEPCGGDHCNMESGRRELDIMGIPEPKFQEDLEKDCIGGDLQMGCKHQDECSCKSIGDGKQCYNKNGSFPGIPKPKKKSFKDRVKEKMDEAKMGNTCPECGGDLGTDAYGSKLCMTLDCNYFKERDIDKDYPSA